MIYTLAKKPRNKIYNTFEDKINITDYAVNKFETFYKDKHEFKDLELTLDRIDGALTESRFNHSKLGNIVHIAGTNGKGSTSHFLSQLLAKNRVKTALFTSPHITCINERILFRTYQDTMIPDDEFDALFDKYEDIIIKYRLSYFEAIFFIAVHWFAQKEPRVTILETGLGGKFDATNTSLITNKLCIITSISQDHADILGHNIYGIIDEKLGILRNYSTMILGINRPFITNYVKSKTKNNIIDVKVPLFAQAAYPHPFSENYSTAHIVAEYLTGKSIPHEKSLALPPCRLEKVDNIILDGSHNPSGFIALVKSGVVPPHTAIVVSCTKERNIRKAVSILSQISDKIVLTSIPDNPRSITKDDTAGLDNTFYCDPAEALAYAARHHKNVLVTGSFYLCAYVKKLLTETSK